MQKLAIEEALKYIKDINSENKPTCSPKVVIYHSLCNDIEKYEIAVLTKNMEELLASTKSKFPNSKIMISLCLQRREPEFNLEVNTMNIALQNLFCSDQSFEICDNSNLFYRGYPQRGIMYDRKHLSRRGTLVLANNLRDELYRLIWPLENIWKLDTGTFTP